MMAAVGLASRTSGEDERLLQLIISNVSVIDIAAELGRIVMAVRTRAYALRIALGRSRFPVKAISLWRRQSHAEGGHSLGRI
jgi:hypothetical protein